MIPIFVSKLMQQLYELLQIQPSQTIAIHLQLDGQIERVNQILEQIFMVFTRQ